MTALPVLEDLPLEPGTRVLLRADFNVPIEDGQISDDWRIQTALPTIAWLRERGAAVVACSHLGRPNPKRAFDSKYSLAPVAKRLGLYLETEVPLAPEVVGAEATALAESLEPGGVMMLENLRFQPGETKGDEELGAALSALAGAYVNDAFGAAHRAHASVIGPPRHLPSAAGRLVVNEVAGLSRLLEEPDRPFLAVLGGAKVADKLGVIDSLLGRCDQLLVGGAMASSFLAALGFPTGASLVEHDQVDACRDRLDTGKVTIPVDVVVAKEMIADTEIRLVPADGVEEGWMILDIGRATASAYGAQIRAGATVFWNGPMGVFELAPFAEGTSEVARAVAHCPGYTVVGGGDSAAALNRFDLARAIDHLSTGGGASLEYLESGDLPGLAALREGKR